MERYSLKGELTVARILIVEDETLIAMMLEDWVVELGHTPVGPASSVSQALTLLHETVCDAAIIDYNLQGQTADPIAELLNVKCVPFIFASGDHILEQDVRFTARPVLTKPYVFSRFDDVVARLLDVKLADVG